MGVRYTEVRAAERSMRSCNDSNMLGPAIEYLKSLPGYHPLKTVRRILTDHSNFTLKRDGYDERDLGKMLHYYAGHLPLDALLVLVCEDCQTPHTDLWKFRNSDRATDLIRQGLWFLPWEEQLPYLQYLVDEREQYHPPHRILFKTRDAFRWPLKIGNIAWALSRLREVQDNHLVQQMQAWRDLVGLATTIK
jgi:hypothetical protein